MGLRAARGCGERGAGRGAGGVAGEAMAVGGQVRDGTVLAAARAETGDCEAAREWQLGAVQAARSAGREDLAKEFGSALADYERDRPCRLD